MDHFVNFIALWTILIAVKIFFSRLEASEEVKFDVDGEAWIVDSEATRIKGGVQRFFMGNGVNLADAVKYGVYFGFLCCCLGFAACRESKSPSVPNGSGNEAVNCDSSWNPGWHAFDSLNGEGEYTQAIAIIDSMQLSANGPISPFCRIRQLRGYAYSHSLRGELELAHDYLFEALELADSIADADLQIQVLVDDAEVYRKAMQFQQAMIRMDQAEYLIQGHGANASTVAYYHDRNASMYEHRNPKHSFDSLLVAVKRALVFARLSEEPYRIASVLNEVGMRHIWVMPDTAMKYWNEAALIFDTIGADRELALIFINKAQVAERDANAALFKSYLDSCRALVRTHTWAYESGMLAELTMRYYKNNAHDSDSAFKYLLDSRSINAAIGQRAYREARAIVESDVKRKDRLLQQNRELRAEYVQRQRTFLVLAVVVIVAMILLFFWLRKRLAFRKLKTASEALADANAQLAKGLDEKAVLVSEIHHRVKNNFQLMANLLMQQAKQVGDERLKAEFTKAKLRILGMGTVHDLIYHQRDNQAVQLPEFIRELGEEILDSQGKLEEDSLHLNCEIQKVSHSEAIYWGILLQELITNSCKYAIVAGQNLEVGIDIRDRGNEASFSYTDNGPGISIGGGHVGTGTYILDAMVRQFDGQRTADANKAIVFGFTYRPPKK